MKHSSLCIVSLLGGMLIGSAITLLFAPKSGEEMRGEIGDFLKKEYDRVRCRCGNKEACDCADEQPAQ